MDSTQASRKIGRGAAQALFFCGMAYAIVTVIGVISLKSPLDPIRDPFFSLMEILIIIMAPLLVVLMVAVHAYAAQDDKVYSLTALAFMILSAGTTTSIHFVVLVASRQVALTSLPGFSLFLSFQWPSVVYILDTLAWDLFYGFSMLFAALVFRGDRWETAVRITMAVSGVLSIAGLICLPFGNIQLRWIGIFGYAGLGPVVFLLLAKVLGRAKAHSQEVARRLSPELRSNNDGENPQVVFKEGSFK